MFVLLEDGLLHIEATSSTMSRPEVGPTKKGSKEATFTALASEFTFDEKIRQLFLDSPMVNLADFR